MTEPTLRTIERIRYLNDPTTVDALLDVFQSLGCPMGSDRWAEFCILYLRELKEKAVTLRKITHNLDNIQQTLKYCGSEIHIKQTHVLVKEFQDRKIKEELEHGDDQCAFIGCNEILYSNYLCKTHYQTESPDNYMKNSEDKI